LAVCCGKAHDQTDHLPHAGVCLVVVASAAAVAQEDTREPGMIYATDEFGFKVVENAVYIHDLHATILHLLGLDHEKVTYRYSGRDFRLTDVAGNVVKEIMV